MRLSEYKLILFTASGIGASGGDEAKKAPFSYSRTCCSDVLIL